MKTIITYKLGDLSNGDFASYDTQKEALKELEEAIDDGTRENIQHIGEEGCPWGDEDDARSAAESFFYVRKHTQNFEKDGDLESEDWDMIVGNNI